MSKVIAIGADHGGVDLKQIIKDHLEEKGYKVIDCGTYNHESVDYPDFADAVVNKVLGGESPIGILVCGTGIGISIKANRHKGIRAAVVHSSFTAEMAKAHNNANILCLGQRVTGIDDACRYVDIWLETDFEGGRHQGRLDKLDA